MTNADLYRLQKTFYEKRGALVGLDPWKSHKWLIAREPEQSAARFSVSVP